MEKVRSGNFVNALMYLLIGFVSVCCLLPMLLVVIVSVTHEQAITLNGYQFFPDRLSISAYRSMFTDSANLINSYLISITVTIIGSGASLLITGCAAYTLANRRVKVRNSLAMYFFFTTMFNGGIVPWYIICTNLGLRDNIWALIIPSMLFNCFNMFLIRNFILAIPESLMESALVDGANDFRICFQIYLPLCAPVLATVVLFIATAYWNDWWNAIMLVDNRRLFPLQYLLFNIQSEIQMMRDLVVTGSVMDRELPNESFKMATVVVTIGPIILLYPLLQRYFVKGMIIGSVKG